MQHSTHPFVLALDLVGGVKMAEALSISPQAVSKMRKFAESNAKYLVPSNHLRAIELVTEGRVTVADLLMASGIDLAPAGEVCASCGLRVLSAQKDSKAA